MMPQTTSTAIPCLRYRDAPAAIDWLCRVLASSAIWSFPTTRAASPCATCAGRRRLRLLRPGRSSVEHRHLRHMDAMTPWS